MEGRDGKTESGSVAHGTSEKISRGLHPTSTTTAREETAERGLTLQFFSALGKRQNTAGDRRPALPPNQSKWSILILSPAIQKNTKMLLTWL